MLSHLVTAAKGLFARTESQENLADPAGASAITSEMATSTRRETAAKDASKSPKTNGAVKQGKRKAPIDEQRTKRQKRSSLEAAESDDEETGSPKTEEKETESEPKSHFRFGSEDPAVPEPQPEQIPQASNNDDEDDSSDDDEAPETIDNSAQLMQMKEKAKKQEKAKQLYVPPKIIPGFLHGYWFSNLQQRGTTKEGKAEET